jgi:hypothetical protein
VGISEAEKLSHIGKFNLNPEGSLLREAQDIGDELQIISGHLKTQFQVIEEFSVLLAERVNHSSVLRGTNASASTSKLHQLLESTASRQGDIEELIQGAAAVHKSVSTFRTVNIFSRLLISQVCRSSRSEAKASSYCRYATPTSHRDAPGCAS